MASRLRLSISPPESKVQNKNNHSLEKIALVYLITLPSMSMINLWLIKIMFGLQGAIFDIELVTTDREFYSRNGTIPYFEALEKSSQVRHENSIIDPIIFCIFIVTSTPLLLLHILCVVRYLRIIFS